MLYSSQKLAIGLCAICVVFALVVVHQMNIIDKLRNTLASSALQRTEKHLARIKKSPPSNQTAIAKKEARKGNGAERHLKNENRSEARMLENQVKEIINLPDDDDCGKIITMEQLKEENEEAYRIVKKSLEYEYNALRTDHEKRLAMLESLSPAFLPAEKFKILQNTLKAKLIEDECNLAFKRHPLPEGSHYDEYGRIYHTPNPNDINMIYIPDIISEYCANAVDLDLNTVVKYLDELDNAMYLYGFMMILPIVKVQ